MKRKSSGARMEGSSFVYETLAPLTAPAEGTLDDLSDSYTVFRSLISSSDPLSAHLPAPDYFSLEPSTEEPAVAPELLYTPNQSSRTTNHPSSAASASSNVSFEHAWPRSKGRFKSPMIRLHKEILDFCDFLSPTQEEETSRASAVQRVFDVVRYIWPHCKVEVFGSFKTGLYLPTSDIDVVILESRVKTPQVGLQALARALSQRGIAKKIQVIGKARVPIVKFIEKESDVAFDLSFDVENGPKAAEFIKDAVAKIPPLRPLCLILKIFLQQRELNEVYSGGIGSYALLSMLIAHLQMQWRSQYSKSGQNSLEQNLGVLLVDFFDFYGRKLNTYDVGISCKLGGALFLKSSKGFQNAERPYLLSIEDPQAPDNDIGKNSFNYFQIRSAFAMAHSLLTDAKVILGLGQDRSILGIIIRPDSILLDRKGGYDGEITFNRLLPGAGLPVQRQITEQHDIQCNWQLFDDEPLPRGNTSADDSSLKNRWKRKGTKGKHGAKAMENGDAVAEAYENGGKKDKKRVKQHKKDDCGNGGNWVPWIQYRNS